MCILCSPPLTSLKEKSSTEIFVMVCKSREKGTVLIFLSIPSDDGIKLSFVKIFLTFA